VAKTSVHLPAPLKERLSEVSRRSGQSQAAIVRAALEHWLDRNLRPQRSPHWGTVTFKPVDLADNVDKLLSHGFGDE
jgi:Arc/MetJ-type ribon-helix-helix transcriptional regulator